MLRRINLIPLSERTRTQSDAGMLTLIVMGILVLAAIAFTYVYFNGVLNDRQRELAALQAETAQVQTQLNALAEYQVLDQERQRAEDVVQHIYAGRTLISQTLGDLSLVIPKEAWLQTLQLTAPPIPSMDAVPEENLKLTGSFSATAQTYTFEDVATALVRLEQIPSFAAVALNTAGNRGASGAGTQSIKTFSLGAALRNTQLPDTPLPLSQVQVNP